MALIYETGASLGCGRNRQAFLREAAKEWRTLGNDFRAELLEKLAKGTRQKINFDQNAITANETVITGYFSPILPALKQTNSTEVIIGKTSITIRPGDIITSQEDRVYRDWLGGQLANPYGPKLLTTFSERLSWNASELLPEIGWHEGARVKDLKYLNITHIPVVGTLVARHKNRCFAVDNNGTFRFEVPLDKLSYPTTRFLRRD